MKKRSLNEDNGYTISDLELTLYGLRKLVVDKLSVKPNAGFVMAKGKPNESRIRYKDMLRVLDSLQTKLGQDGCLSFGVCKTCTRFNPKASLTGEFGACGTKIVHEYDSCPNHSKSGGGYGL